MTLVIIVALWITWVVFGILGILAGLLAYLHPTARITFSAQRPFVWIDLGG